jgi:hypothetical protein
LVEPDNIDSVKLDPYDIAILTTCRTPLIRANHIAEARKGWVIFQIRIDGILYRCVLVEVMFIDDGVRLRDLLFIRAGPTF